MGAARIVSGDAITALVLSLPTVGPLLFRALLTEDMYLAGTIVMFLCFLTIIGMFVSDLVLAVIDPASASREPRPDQSGTLSPWLSLIRSES